MHYLCFLMPTYFCSITIITGFSSSEVIGQSAFRYIFQEDQTQVFQDLSKTLHFIVSR